MIILGINAYHGDSSACLLVDGKLLAAAEEERFLRIKHWAGFPVEAIKFCLSEGGIKVSDITHVAINRNPRSNLHKKIFYTLLHRPKLQLIINRIKNSNSISSIEDELHKAFPSERFNGTVCNVEHHAAHLASAFYVSPFDKSIAVSVDGFGDFSSTAWAVCEKNLINIENRIFFPHSLGIFYQSLTQFIGFNNYGDEYKVMGLAPYGKPTFIKEMRKLVKLLPDGRFRLNLNYFQHHKKNISHEWGGGSPKIGTLYSPELINLLGPSRGIDDPITQRHSDLARSAQMMYEEAFFHLLNSLYDRHGIDSLAISGGCGMNSVANGKVTLKTPFKKVYVQSAAGDAGGAIGAAYLIWHQFGGGLRSVHNHAYWGPQFTNDEIGQLLNNRSADLISPKYQISFINNNEDLCRITAEAVARGEVIGWFQGRMEWGPRALGNRSIIGDPRRADMKDILNIKIKRRESFRPFAPSVLKDYVGEWFEQTGDVPFMMQVYQIKQEKRALIPAVTHVDGSGRLQTVMREANSRYYSLISEFNKITGIPMVLNTSFNENEPVVCKPNEALNCFLRTRMDVLVMENWVIKRLN